MSGQIKGKGGYVIVYSQISALLGHHLLPPAADGKKSRNPQLDFKQTVTDFETLSIKWNVSIKYISQDSGILMEEEVERVHYNLNNKRNHFAKVTGEKTGTCDVALLV